MVLKVSFATVLSLFSSVLVLRTINVTLPLLHCELCLFLCLFVRSLSAAPLMFTCFLRDKLLCASFGTMRVPGGASWIQKDFFFELFGSASPSVLPADWRCCNLFQKILLLFPPLLWPGSNPSWSGGSGVDTFGDIWPQQCSFNHVVARASARLIKLSDRAELLSEESSVH